MTLRARLLAVALIVIAAIAVSVQATRYLAEEDWIEENLPLYESQLYREVIDLAYEPRDADGVEVVRRILAIGPDHFRSYFRDVLISNGPSPESRGSVDLNPLGALHRDPATFPLEEIRAGIRDAMSTRRAVVASDGFCVPIESGDDVVGGAWLAPIGLRPPELSVWTYLLPILIGILVFGFVAFTAIERGVAKPLRDLGVAAAGVGAGQVGVRVPRIAGASELDRFVDAFNEMAARVEGHRNELEREVRQATETAEKRQTALLRSARLASMGALAAGIAHEINNPIGGMLNAVRRIGESEGLSERDRRYLELTQEGLERIGRIARRVLDFTPKTIEAKPFSLEGAIEGARALADHRFTHEAVDLRLDLAPELPLLVGDAHEFQQVLLNVFINSLDVLEGRPEPRWIAVRAYAEAGAPRGSELVRSDPGRTDLGGEKVKIVIEDNGPGMDADRLALVMDPFFSGKGRPDASGLGMFISHQIIENHGGVLEVDSEVGVGFTVTIQMPTADAV